MKKITKNVSDIPSLVEQYAMLSAQQKQIKKQLDSISKKLKEYAMQTGVEDDKGSKHCETEDYLFGCTCKRSVSLKSDAVDILKTLGYEECVMTKEVVDEEMVERKVSSGEMEEEDFAQIMKSNLTYAIYVKEKEALEEVQHSTLRAAFRK